MRGVALPGVQRQHRRIPPSRALRQDYSNYDAEFRAVSRVYEKYYAALMTGTVDPDDYLPKLMEELQNAGIDRLKQALQDQIDAWLRNT